MRYSLLSITSVLLLILSTVWSGVWSIYIVFVSLLPLLYLLQITNIKQAICYGFFIGIFYYLALFNWIYGVLHIYGSASCFLSILMLFALAVYMSMYLVLFSAGISVMAHRYSSLIVLWLVPLLWVGLDWLKSFLFTGLPWMDLGYVLAMHPRLIQFADIFGHYGVTYVIVLVNTLFCMLIVEQKKRWYFLKLTLPVFLLLSVIALYSTSRWDQVDGENNKTEVTVGIVQGNIGQLQKWLPEELDAVVDKYQDFTLQLLAKRDAELVVWPETAFPHSPADRLYGSELKNLIIASGVPLLTGAPWYTVSSQKITNDREPSSKITYYNSAIYLDSRGEISGKYFKTHLVPFGEYIPMKKFLSFLGPLVNTAGDFMPGKIEKPIISGKMKIGTLICFETVFSELSRKWVDAGANLLVNISNDAWYGESIAPYHSISMAVFRAVEARRSVVRSANTGFSAFVDPLGRINKQSALFVDWYDIGRVELRQEKTFWAQYGYLFGPICFFVSIFVLAGAIIRLKF